MVERTAPHRLPASPRAGAIPALLFALALLSCDAPTATEVREPEPTPTPTELGSEAQPAAEAARPTPARLRHGVDLSMHSGSIEWPTLARQDFDFVFLKATEGVDLADAAFAEHWSAAGEAGLVRGAYHFYVTEDDPLQQADFFISKVALAPGDLLPVVDIELIGHGTPPGLAERLRTFLERIEQHYGVRPMIYTSPNFWSRHLDGSFGDYPLWIAEYEVDQPRLPTGWESWTLWQYADDSDVPGVEKDADLSRPNPQIDARTLLIPHWADEPRHAGDPPR